MTTPKPVTTSEPKTHELKCLPGPFMAMRAGSKRFEFRRDDRDFQVGDTLLVREYDAVIKNGEVAARTGYTGDEDSYQVTYKLVGEFGVPHGYCVLGIAPLRAKDSPDTTPIFYCLVGAFTEPTAPHDPANPRCPANKGTHPGGELQDCLCRTRPGPGTQPIAVTDAEETP